MFETLPGLVLVAALDAAGGRASYSYFGNNAVTLAAPGGEAGGAGRSIWVPMVRTPYGFAQGTSYAAPLVAGAVVLLLGVRPDLDGHSVIDLLQRTARSLPIDQGMGAGALDIAAALRAASEPAPMPCACQSSSDNDRPQQAQTDINTAPAAALAVLPMLGS
jgi:subtilisin family serine protease